MFEGDMSKKLGDTAIAKKLQRKMANGGLDVKARQRVFDAIYNSRQKFVSLVETIKEGAQLL